MKWIGQHIYDLVSRFRDDVYLEDISTGTIASGAHLGLDSNNKIVKAVDGGGDLTSIIAGTGLSGDNLSGPIPELTVDASQPGITTLAGVSAIGTAGTPIVITSDAVTFQSVNADDPIVTIKNTSNAANDMASLKFVKDRGAAPAVGDNLAEIYFIGEDSGQNSQEYGRILCETDVVTDGQESGKLKLGVANHDGGNGFGLIMTGGSVNDEVDVTIGLGANSVVTVPGSIAGDVTGDVTGDVSGSSGSCTGEAATVETIAGLAPNTATTQATQGSITSCANLVTVGTIGTGVWNATAIASAKMATGTASAQGALELATTGEADTGTDTARAVTPAGLKSHVDTRYSYSYITLSASAKPTKDGSDNPEWMVPNINKGIYEEDWNFDTGITSVTTGTTTYGFSRYTTVNSFIIPHAGILVGFHGIGRNGTADRTFKAGLFHADNGLGGAGADGSVGEGIDYGNNAATNEFSLRCVATASEGDKSGGTDGTTNHVLTGPCQLISNSANLQLQAGDALMPAIMGNDTGATDEIFVSMTIILKIPLA